MNSTTTVQTPVSHALTPFAFLPFLLIRNDRPGVAPPMPAAAAEASQSNQHLKKRKLALTDVQRALPSVSPPDLDPLFRRSTKAQCLETLECSASSHGFGRFRCLSFQGGRSWTDYRSLPLVATRTARRQSRHLVKL
ncbi:hypothetical protein R1flu_017880 [Riccia fluitans]|uniref:Uncharacterized protein n=1 Tax=Riccia fluitans TaxID=41844 RepID=A0ABD1ZEF8_9MARC